MFTYDSFCKAKISVAQKKIMAWYQKFMINNFNGTVVCVKYICNITSLEFLPLYATINFIPIAALISV